jgi:hypothetical protein
MSQKFGEIVVELGFITKDQLHTAMKMQKNSRVKLGEIMTQLLILTPYQVKDVLKYQGGDKNQGDRFGVCAVKMGLVTEESREKAVKYQNTGQGILGELLVDLGFLTEEQKNRIVQEYIVV